MLTANKLIPQARGLAAALLRRATTVELPWDVRCKSRFDATDSAGRALGVFLPRGTAVRGGDVLVAEDGSLVLVKAAAEAVLVVRAGERGGALALLRAAYHLGNRHVALEVQPDHLKLEPDHVLAEMLRAMHLVVSEEPGAFEPEGGAYAGHGNDSGTGHGHAHHDQGGHDHGHDRRDHRQPHEHDPAEPAAPLLGQPPRGKPLKITVAAEPAPHVHGPGCGHDHGPRGH